MDGSARLKKTAFLMSFDAPNLLQSCDGKHAHLPWGQTISPHSGQSVFSTSVETEYPWKLCKQLALAFALQLQKRGKFLETQKISMDVNQRMGAGAQPRGKLSPLMVAEFKYKVVVKSSGVSVPKVIEDSAQAPFQGVPIHSKLISSRTEMVKKGDKGENEIQVSEFGVYRSPEEFIQFVSRLQHPLDSPQLLDASNMRAMLAIRDWKQAEILAFRAQSLRWYTDLAVQLKEDECQLRKQMDPQVEAVLKGNRLLLFKQMCFDAGVGDESLFQELTDGFRLTGQMQDSGQFPKKLKPASLTVQVHLRLAERTRAGLPMGPAGELPLDKHVEDVLRLPSVMWLLMPKQKVTIVDKQPTATAPRAAQPKHNPTQPDKRGQPKGGKFDKKQKRNMKTPMPLQLRGGTPVDGEGRSICYGYNLGTCHDKACKRGRHVCCKEGCYSSSPFWLKKFGSKVLVSGGRGAFPTGRSWSGTALSF